ncbi:MAG TPA: HAMP domain-containing sensor histidine kinase [Anaerolineales bacterium]|nr:HAMP domain-containing sensor histidine kinase [Anaerolineales bacterium]
MGSSVDASRASGNSETHLLEQVTALRNRNDDLAAYAHTVAHNLKDPLAVIIGTSDAIFHITDLTTEELHAYLGQIDSTAHKMNDMIDNLLFLSELHEVEAPVAPLDMGVIVSNIRNRLSYLIREHHAQVTAPECWPAARGYAPWVEEIWANLISNSIKYGGQPPHVELGAASRLDGRVLFSTRDNGRGLSPEEQDRLFKPFSQTGPIHKPGHGLGLWIVRRIVEKLGGEVGVETEVGKGSLFFFTLPAL